MDFIDVREITLKPNMNLIGKESFKIISDNKNKDKVFLQFESANFLVSLIWDREEGPLNEISIKEETSNYPKHRILDAMFSEDGRYYYELKEGLGLVVIRTGNNKIEHIYSKIKVSSRRVCLKEVLDRRFKRVLLV